MARRVRINHSLWIKALWIKVNLTSGKIASFESTLQVQTHSHLRRFMIPYELLNKAAGRGSTLQTMLSGIR
jgi:hypothetical protein